MAMCDVPGCDAHYGCRIKNKGVQVSPRATPSRVRHPHPVPREPPAYNREIMYSHRPGGTKVPLINGTTGDVIRRKEYENKRHSYETIRRRQHTATTS